MSVYEEMLAEENRNLVKAAALHMDSVKPDWWRHVDPLILDLQDSNACICGQNGLGWKEHRVAFLRAFSDRDLEPYWLEEIAQRMLLRPSPSRKK